MKDGTRKEGIEWSARLLTDGNDEPKIKFYQVFIVSAGGWSGRPEGQGGEAD
jgi:hypothetical protein